MKLFIFIMCCCVFVPAHEVKSASLCGTDLYNNGDGTIKDTRTGLIWKKCLEGLSGTNCDTGAAVTKDWSSAVDMGDGTWRVPNIKELQSLVDESASNPAINTTCFPDTPSGNVLWSSSPNADTSNGERAWVVDFTYGLTGALLRTESYNVRLVKDAE